MRCDFHLKNKGVVVLQWNSTRGYGSAVSAACELAGITCVL